MPRIIHGRINRMTFFAGFAMTGFVTLVLVFFFLAPFALLELAFSGLSSNLFFDVLQRLFLAIPIIFFGLASFSLVVKRAQDFNSNGIYWFVCLLLFFGVNRFMHPKVLSLALVITAGILALKPGSKRRNKYGGKPPKKILLQDVGRI